MIPVAVFFLILLLLACIPVYQTAGKAAGRLFPRRESARPVLGLCCAALFFLAGCTVGLLSLNALRRAEYARGAASVPVQTFDFLRVLPEIPETPETDDAAVPEASSPSRAAASDAADPENLTPSEPAPADTTVYYTESGSVLHLDPDCPHLASAKEVLSGRLADAPERPLCSRCGG